MAIERTIILPLQDNNQVSLETEVATILDEIASAFGAYPKQLQVGVWKDSDGTIYNDDSVRVTVVSDDGATDFKLQQCIYRWCELLRQVCIYTDSRRVKKQLVYARSSVTA